MRRWRVCVILYKVHLFILYILYNELQIISISIFEQLSLIFIFNVHASYLKINAIKL